MDRRASRTRWRPPGSAAVLSILAAALTAALGLAILSGQPGRFRLQRTLVAPDADPLIPVDALGVAHHDFAHVVGEREVVLERVMYGSRKIVWQTTLAGHPRLTGAMDVTGNGFDALCVSATGADGPVAIVLDRDGQRIARLAVPAPGPAERVALMGADLVIRLAVTQDGRRKLLCSLDRASNPGAELILFDLVSGKPDWSVPVASTPRNVLAADLDGDGRSEFLLSTISGPDSAERPDAAGSECAVLALSENGMRLWSVPLEPGFATSGVVAAGHEARGGALVVATSRTLEPGDTLSGRVVLLEGTSGAVLGHRELRSALGSPREVPGTTPRIVVGSREGTLRLFDLELDPIAERSFAGPLEVEECADLDHDGRFELVAATPRGVLILDERLHTLATLRFATPQPALPEVRLASAGLGNSRLVVSGTAGMVADVTPVPPLGDPVRLGTVGALALIAGVWVRVRVGRQAWRRATSGAEAREFLLDYHQIRHETFGRERPFARVRLWAQAQVAGHPLPAEVLENARDEFRRIGVPTLARFAHRAAGLGVPRAQVRRVTGLTREVETALRAACAAPPGQVQGLVEGALTTMTALSEECLAAYREVALRDVCRPDDEAQEAILAKRAVLDHHRVALDFHVDPSGKQPVLFDSSELRALIGELIENGARALEATPDAEIRVTVAGKPGDARWVVLRIEDNGPGIPRERREAVFAPGGSSHPEGGFGLRRAREIAQRWLADLAIEEMEGRRGAALKLSLRSLLPHDAVAAGDVPTHPPIGEHR